MSEPDRTHALSDRTTPTWEVELLISGVAVFAMLQLPGWLDDRMFALEPRLGDDWRLVLTLFYIYSKSAAIVLAVTFALHLFLRALWIALVGMHSVYPQGIILDRLRIVGGILGGALLADHVLSDGEDDPRFNRRHEVGPVERDDDCPRRVGVAQGAPRAGDGLFA